MKYANQFNSSFVCVLLCGQFEKWYNTQNCSLKHYTFQDPSCKPSLIPSSSTKSITILSSSKANSSVKSSVNSWHKKFNKEEQGEQCQLANHHNNNTNCWSRDPNTCMIFLIVSFLIYYLSCFMICKSNYN